MTRRGLAMTSLAALALLAACSSGGSARTVACRALIAEFRFNPSDGAELRVADEKLGWVDGGGRGLDEDRCERVETQTGWFVVRYQRTAKPVTLHCRLPGRFFLHGHPTFSSESGEDFADGNALYVVVPNKHTIVASAGIGEDASKSHLSYSARYCTPR